MLKIEKRKNSELHVTFRENLSWINEVSFRAFLIAFCIHLFAICTFYIHRAFNDSTYVLPFTVVIASEEHGEVTGNLESGTGKKIQHPGPSLSNPSLTLFKTETPPIIFDFVDSFKQDGHNPFFSDEEAVEELLLGTNVNKLPIEIMISGELGNFTFTQDYLPDLTRELAISFQVQVDLVSGRIFWYSPVNVDSEAEKILKNLQFQKDPNQFVKTGEIQIIFRK